jgi:hypothetical protein
VKITPTPSAAATTSSRPHINSFSIFFYFFKLIFLFNHLPLTPPKFLISFQFLNSFIFQTFNQKTPFGIEAARARIESSFPAKPWRLRHEKNYGAPRGL